MFTYEWVHRVTIPPLEAVLDAVEAFFTTLPAGRYAIAQRERFCLELRRGAWRGKWLDPSVRVPRFFGIDRRDVRTWPTRLTVTALPSPGEFDLRIERVVQTPNGLPLQNGHVQAGADAFAQETEQLVAYLAEFLHLGEQPIVREEKNEKR